jgi:hypothetical protein
MSRRGRVFRALLAGTFALCACSAPLITADAPKNVAGKPLHPYELHEECVELEPGGRVEYAYESTEPVDFNIQFHDGDTVVMPVVREHSRADAGVYASPFAQHYCLMWEAGPAGASIDYRIRVKPAQS